MQSEEAHRLQQKWGSKPCMHPNIESEFFLGTRTGEFNCTTCGAEFVTKQEWQQERAEIKNKMRDYQELALCLSRYQHQIQQIEQQLSWLIEQNDQQTRLNLEEDRRVLMERIALLTWVTGFNENDSYTSTLPGKGA